MNRWLAGALSALALLSPLSASADYTIKGTTRFAQLVELHPPQPGRVARITVDETDTVKANDVLLELESEIQAARIRVAEIAASATASISRGEVVVEQARSRLKRIERAASRGAAPKWEIAEARLAVRAAEADLASLREQAEANQARLALERAGMEQFLVRAPFDGEVLEISATLGTLSDGRTPLIVLANRDDVELLAFVPASNAGSLQAAGPFSAALGPPVSRDVKIELLSIDPRVEPASGTVRAVFRIVDTDFQVPAGVEAVITLPGDG